MSVNPDDPDKADMRIVQASAQEVITVCSNIYLWQWGILVM